MVMEKVQEIKKSEEKAGAIIKSAEDNAADIASSLESKINEFKDFKEEQIAGEIKKYREAGDKETEAKINALRQEYLHKLTGLKEVSERKVSSISESVWKEIKKVLMPQ